VGKKGRYLVLATGSVGQTGTYVFGVGRNLRPNQHINLHIDRRFCTEQWTEQLTCQNSTGVSTAFS